MVLADIKVSRRFVVPSLAGLVADDLGAIRSPIQGARRTPSGRDQDNDRTGRIACGGDAEIASDGGELQAVERGIERTLLFGSSADGRY